MLDFYRWICRVAGRAQIFLIGLSIIIAVLAAAQLQYQKDIINGLAEKMDWHQVLFLGAQFLGLLLLSSGLKFALGYRSSLLGESSIRDLRNRIFLTHRKNKAPADERSDRQGSLVTMISAAAEGVGSFAGEAIATPLMQIGVLVSVIAFIAATQPVLGAIVLAVVLLQAVIVLGIQKRMNLKIEERVKVLRHTTDQVLAEDLESVERSILADFDKIYEARRKIFLLKQSSKFTLSAIYALGTAGVLMLGGWLVLEGRTDIGTVVADLTGLARIAQPWRELISFFRRLSGVQVKHDLLKGSLAT